MAFYRCVPSAKQIGGDGLPAGYTRVKFLESIGDGTNIYPYLDTLIVPNGNTQVLFDTEMHVSSRDDNSIRQGRHGGGQRLSIFLSSELGEYAIGNFIQDNIYAELFRVRGTHKLDTSNMTAYHNGNIVLQFGNAISWTNNQTIWLFKRNTNGSEDTERFRGSCVRNYSVIITVDKNTVRDFVPAVDPTGRPCMYDLISKQPFYNNGGREFGYELMDGTYIAPI